MDPNQFAGMGLSGLAAQEIAAQVTSGTPDVNRLMATGMSAINAQQIAAMITAGQTTPLLLAQSTDIGI